MPVTVLNILVTLFAQCSNLSSFSFLSSYLDLSLSFLSSSIISKNLLNKSGSRVCFKTFCSSPTFIFRKSKSLPFPHSSPNIQHHSLFQLLLILTVILLPLNLTSQHTTHQHYFSCYGKIKGNIVKPQTVWQWTNRQSVSHVVSRMKLGMAMENCKFVVLELELTGVVTNWRHLKHTNRTADKYKMLLSQHYFVPKAATLKPLDSRLCGRKDSSI